MIRFLTISILLFLSIGAQAQTPAHFIIGEKSFTGVNIYDIHQDYKNNYWIATNNGLYFYDGYVFEPITCSDKLSASVFSPRSDDNGNIFCYNLGGQVFKIDQDKNCEVYFQIPDSLLSSMIQLHVSSNGELLINSKRPFHVQGGKIKTILDPNPIRFVIEFLERDDSIEFIGYIHDTLVRFSFDEKTFEPSRKNLVSLEFDDLDPINLIYQDNREIFYKRNSGQVLEYFDDTAVFLSQCEKSMTRMNYERGLFWGLSNKVGLSIFPNIAKPDENKFICFPRIKISSFTVDHENNILLGTFGHGIIVIPESQIMTYALNDDQGEISEISRSNDESIIYGTNMGVVGRMYPSGRKEIITEVNSYIELLEYMPEEHELVVGCTRPFLQSLKTGLKKYPSLGSIKDIKRFSDNQYLLATDVGVKLYHPIKAEREKENIGWPKHDKLGSLYNQRTNSIGFDPVKKIFYAGSLSGLKKLTQDGPKTIKDGEHEIIAKEMVLMGDHVYIVSIDQGIYVFKDGEQIDHWTSDDKLFSNTVQTITNDDDRLFIASNEGIQVCNKNGETLLNLKQSDGLDENSPTDLVINSNILWVLYQNVMQSIDLTAYEGLTYTPEISLDEIIVNGLKTDTNNHVYSHDHNKWSFSFITKTLKYRSEIVYKHRLLGIDEGWVSSPYEERIVTYKSLPPGSYEFQVKAAFRENESTVQSFSFEIQSPFWYTWWFYLILLIILSSLFLIVFNIILRRQSRRAKLREELQESKLIAIQAQMNPHFIFNALNSIQDLVLKNEAESAYGYISKFALLVRNTLNQSDQEYVEFKEEIDALKIYLELEKLRFSDKLEYEIIYDTDIEAMIPPMLIQPFVENSIVHGLLHKSGEKKLSITFKLKENLICIVKDNGIGREEARAIRERQFGKHKSFASKAVDKRLEILSNRHKGQFTVYYEDHYEGEKSTGTSVIITIPFLSRF